MNDWFKEFLKGTLSAALVSIAASSIAVYVATQVQQVEITHLQQQIEKIDRNLESIRKDIYRPAFN